MRRSSQLIQTGFWPLLVLFASFRLQAAQVPPPVSEPVPLPKSVFVDDANMGKDPFFPLSTRRGPQKVKDVPVIDTIPDIALKGVSGAVTRRLAIINNKTFEVGEEGELKSKGQNVRIKCVEIKEKSVVVRINGLERELFLSPR